MSEPIKVTRVTIRDPDGSVSKLGQKHYYGRPKNVRCYVGSKTGVPQFISSWVKRGMYAEVEEGYVVFGPPVRVDS